MYVLMDIEWITNRSNHICPTQIAALRVSEQWNETDRFFARIRPRDSSFHQWNHMGYSGGTAEEFLNADSLTRVLVDLDVWLDKDDVLCWWTPDSIGVFNSIFLMVLKRHNPHEHIRLSDFVFPYLKAQKITTGNPYKIAEAHGIFRFSPRHQSLSDVLTMRSVLACVKFPISRLSEPVAQQKQPKQVREQNVSENWLYQYDEASGYIHRRGCTAIPADAKLKGYMKLQTCLRKKFIPCPVCIAEEYRHARRNRNRDVIDRTQYQFVYSENSQVFHRRGCDRILNTTGTINGSVYYDGCVKTGRRPCKICNPKPETWVSVQAVKKARRKAKVPAQNAAVPARSMTAVEQRAYDRFVEAREERLSTAPTAFKTETEKDDFFTLTQPRFAFFCGAGYQTFHQRNCRKLQGLTNITGFPRYKDAVKSGHTPCKVCKPTAKQDIEYAIPITSQKRKGESINDLKKLCDDQGYTYEIQDQYFCFATTVGRWKIDVSAHPYVVYHINRVVAPKNEYDYHRQPRLFLSLADTFEYIERHDQKLRERTQHMIDDREAEITTG